MRNIKKLKKYNKVKILILFSIFVMGAMCGKNIVKILDKRIEDIKTTIITYNQEDKIYGMPYINPAWIEYNELSEEDKKNVEQIPNKYIYSYLNEDNLYGEYSELPSRFTLRDEYPTNQYNQGTEGLCWAYSTATMIESNLKVTKGINEKISRNQLAILTSNRYNGYNLDRKLRSGLPYTSEFSFSNVLFGTGVIPAVDPLESPEEDYYTLSSDYTLGDLIYSENNKYTITDTITFPEYENNENYRNMLKSFIKKYGAVRFTTFWTDLPAYYDSEKRLMFGTNIHGSGHAMVIVGWDDDFENPNGNGAWIIQNSWTTDNNTPPYYYAYDIDSVMIQNIIGIRNIDIKTWDNSYTYVDYPTVEYQGMGTKNDMIPEELESPEIHETDYESDPMKDVVAITGTASITYTKDKSKKEKINMINILTASQNGTYTVLVSPKGDNRYKLVGEIETTLPGIYTIKPKEDIELNNDKFTIKIISDDGAFYRYTNVFTNITEEKDDVTEDKLVATQIGKNNNGNFVYKVALYKALPNNRQIEINKEINGETSEIIRTTMYNGRAVGLFEVPYYTTSGSEIKISYKDEEELIFEYKPTGYLGGMTGEGTSQNPYLVTTPEQLKLISEQPTAYYKLENDIDLSTIDPAETAYLGWESIDNFAGTLDGGGHKIKNLYVATDNTSFAGLFKNLRNATIKNLILENFESIGNVRENSAILANHVKDSTIENVAVLANFDQRQIAFIKAGEGATINGLYINTFKSKNQMNNTIYILDEWTGAYNAVSNVAIITDFNVNIKNIKNFNNVYIISNPDAQIALNTNGQENVYIYNTEQTSMGDGITVFNNIDEYKTKSLNDISFDSNKWIKNSNDALPTLKDANIKFINNLETPQEITLNRGETKNAEVIITPNDAFNTKLSYETSDSEIAQIDNEGNITGIASGTATITVRTIDGSNIIKTINVVVGSDIQVVFKYNNYEDKQIYPSGTTITLPTEDKNQDEIRGWKLTQFSNEVIASGTEYTINSTETFYATYGNTILENSIYEYDDSKGIIKRICLVDVNEYINNLNLSSEYTAKVFVEDNEITEGMIQTDSITRIYRGTELVEEYTNSVHGDVYPDGYVGMNDVIAIIRYKMDMMELDEVQKLAADFSRDGKIRLNDASIIRNLVANSKNTGKGVCPYAN